MINLYPPPIDTTGTQFPIRLVGGATRNEGRVEIEFQGTWGTICDDYWGLDDAHVSNSHATMYSVSCK